MPSRAYVVTLGNEKGGSGKSTTAMHLFVALARSGLHVGALDLDLRQRSFFRYLENRRAYGERAGAPLRLPRQIVVERSTASLREHAEQEDRDASEKRDPQGHQEINPGRERRQSAVGVVHILLWNVIGSRASRTVGHGRSRTLSDGVESGAAETLESGPRFGCGDDSRDPFVSSVRSSGNCYSVVNGGSWVWWILHAVEFDPSTR